MCKVSIVVPVYNVEKYLEQCLNSLVNQTLDDIEIIVVDDGSTDTSSQIIKRFSEKYHKIKAYKKENGGLSDARNFGMQYVTGEYVGFVDSDDYVETTMYELLYKKAKEEHSDMVECNLFHDFLDSITPEMGEWITDKQKMIRVGRSVVWNKIYKTDWLKSLNVQFPKGLIYEDVEFYSKIVPYVNKVSYIDDVLIHYVQRGASINNKSTIKTKQILMILDNIIKYYKEKNIYHEYEKSLEYLTARIVLCSSFSRMIRIADKKDRKKALADNYKFLVVNFPNWKKNPYLREGGLKNKYMRLINKQTYWIMYGLFRAKLYIEKDKKF